MAYLFMVEKVPSIYLRVGGQLLYIISLLSVITEGSGAGNINAGQTSDVTNNRMKPCCRGILTMHLLNLVNMVFKIPGSVPF